MRAGKNRNKSGWVKGLLQKTQDEDVTYAASRGYVKPVLVRLEMTAQNV
jgi:hypothetical protein